MRKNTILLVAALAFASLLTGCVKKSTTEITMMSDDAECYLGTVVNKPDHSSGKEWLLKNTGSTTLRIDSVITSSDCVELFFPYLKSVTTIRKFHFLWWSKQTTRETVMRSYDCSKENQNALPVESEPGEYFPVRAMLHPAEGQQGRFSYTITLYGNFTTSPLRLSLDGTYELPDSTMAEDTMSEE